MAQKGLEEALLSLQEKVHRRSKARRVKSLDDARRLLKELTILSLSAEEHFPSLLSSLDSKRTRRKKQTSTGRWPVDAWWWGSALADDPWVLETRLLRGKPLFVHESLWPQLDAYVRSLFLQIRRGRLKLGELQEQILDTLHQEGPTRSDVMRGLLGLNSAEEAREFQKGKRTLESMGLLLGQSVGETGQQVHVDRLSLWTHRFPKALGRNAPYQGLADFLQTTLHACVYVPERKFFSWWTWPKEDVRSATEILVSGGAALLVELGNRAGLTTAERLNEAFKALK